MPDCRITFRRHDANDLRQNDAAGEDIAGPSRKEQTDAARRRARQSIREYGLIGLLRQRLRAVSWPHWRLRCMQPLHGHGMGCQTLITLTQRPATAQRVTRASCAQLLLLRSDFCAWRRLLLICWKLLIGVCVRDGLAASVCVYRTSAASVELRPRDWRAVAFPRWLHLS